MSFIKKNCSFKISSLFGGYLWIYPVNIIEQPHGSDQCGYIHLLYRFIFWFTVVEVGDLCRLGCACCWVCCWSYLMLLLFNGFSLMSNKSNVQTLRYTFINCVCTKLQLPIFAWYIRIFWETDIMFSGILFSSIPTKSFPVGWFCCFFECLISSCNFWRNSIII